MTDVILPALSPTMESGTLSRWFVSVGSSIKRGEPLAEIETDKASIELTSEHDGVIDQLLVAAGTPDVKVGAVIARLGGNGKVVQASARVSAAVQTATQPGEPPAPEPEPHAEPEPARVPTHSDVVRAPARGADLTVLASPMARRLARQLGIELSSVRGTGEHGRITKRDLEAVDARLSEPEPAPPRSERTAEPTYAPAREVPHEVVPLSAMRKTIARRLAESKRSAPHFYMTVDADVGALLALREQCNARGEGEKLSLNDFIVRATGLALARVKAANVQYGGHVAYRYERVDLSIAVAVAEGLHTPVIRDVPSKSVQAIARELKALADKARNGKLLPEEYEGGTFSISNLGMYGIKQFEAVINPPQAGILAVGAVERRVVPGDGESVRVASLLCLTLSCDHRVIDGAVAAELLREIKRRVEDPLGLVLM
jgi:pyruvate dehydrogenase E2 component (dihydrolipoamide acetyltransferase)